MINTTTHKLLGVVESEIAHAFQVTFKDSEVLILQNLCPVDPSVYGSNGLWTGEIVRGVRILVKKEMFRKPGSFLDFKEEDVEEIIAAI